MGSQKVAPDVSMYKLDVTEQIDTNDECRLRRYLAYNDANSAKWRRVRNLIDPEPDGDIKLDQVDLEGDESKTAPIALDGGECLTELR